MNKKFDKPWLQNQQNLLKNVAWVNIITQFVFPVAGTFAPAIATAKTQATFQNEPLALPTETYILKSGETINTIAKRYGLTVSDLQKINQLRTFNKSFMALGAGSEIEVPKSRNNKFLPFNYSSLDKTSLDKTAAANENSRHLAEVASQLGHLLATDNIKNGATSQLSNLVMSEANQQIKNWLGSYGTVRVQANLNNRGNLNGSQLDMLLPLYDTRHQIVFTQFGLRRLDKRTTANFGLGQRHFFDGWMLGYNAFLDHDFTGDNTRFGLGAEYARNYLKLGANGYFRLSHWKESRLLTDYDERPANGFDLRIQGYAPAIPQLGGKLMYEQYFGNEVGLINKDHRSRNPSMLTAGVSYTPVPLLTFGIERKQEMSGNGETQFNMELNYAIGTPWAKQIDPDTVTFRRSLQGGRYDLIERNNQIVLEYRKREVISLAMDNQIIGHAGENKPLHISINSKYGFKDIQWEATNLFANGGKIQHQSGTHYLLTLPKYQTQGSTNTNNTYTVGAVAYDEQGNASKHAEMQVHVLPAEVNANNSTFTAKDKEMPADGHSTTLLTLTLKDKEGNPISGVASDIKLVSSGLSGEDSDPAIAKMKETQPGIYESLLTAGGKVGVLNITPEVDGIIVKPVDILFVHATIPLVKNLTLKGKLEMGQTLSATYTFNANHGDTTDKSRYAWGNKGSTDVTKGHTITESGKIPDYILTQSDAGTVKEIAVQAQNALGLIGNTQVVDTSMSVEQGNHTHDGGKGGTVRGLADNITSTLSADKVKKGDAITLKITALNHGKPVRNVAIRIEATGAQNRHGDPQKATALFNGKLNVYQGITDNNGMLSITITDPNAMGLKTLFSITAEGTAAPQIQNVIFTVVTSPDIPEANFWGHMPNTVTSADGTVFYRPVLQSELGIPSTIKKPHPYTEHNEIWSARAPKGAEWSCKVAGKKLPTKDQLENLYLAHPDNAMYTEYGWPKGRSYRSSSPEIDGKGKDTYYSVNIDTGLEHVIDYKIYDYVICVD
ncbi:putative invasin [Xenorhabdus beddingii]|uniref:Putative invasin n=1 Tax=Xenorhabdus beddingii TaxID=40578 RepID=A0A1Y2SQ46_9GAMM|nr:inverse autotransporter beta domain-containing protein [Xenorhabdus beddingii]OTA20876.1 putative invasin [Xenorhabdus beddingii]